MNDRLPPPPTPQIMLLALGGMLVFFTVATALKTKPLAPPTPCATPGFLYVLDGNGLWDRVRVGTSSHLLASGGDVYVQESAGDPTSSSGYRKLTPEEREALLLEAFLNKPIGDE